MLKDGDYHIEMIGILKKIRCADLSNYYASALKNE